ncbi:MAG: hypothetical protein QOE36_1951 [Gaiellaceae bacterium]|nr:hypothetical protein [Gaiellaceae bacterium]
MSEPEAELDDRHRRRREEKQKRIRRRRRTALAVLLALVAGGVSGGYVLAGGGSGGGKSAGAAQATTTEKAKPRPKPHRAPPTEVRGVHVTMALASIPGKLGEYFALRTSGLNAIELDVKDENGEVGFIPSSVPLAKAVGAAKAYYKPRVVAREAHRHGLYLIGRVVTFEDPILSEKRPAFAIRTSDGSIWRNSAGLGWTNPYDRRVWKYNVDLATAAIRAGFDEIQFDYVRFPSDGDLSIIRYPGVHPQPMGWTVPAFVQYASKRIHPLGARLSVDVFGLSATRDLGIGQYPSRIGRYVDAVYPMVYPSHYNSGEFNLDDPSANPSATVANSLTDFQRALTGRKARIVPWLQDFSLGRTYTINEVREQITAARLLHTGGYLLWNPVGLYSSGALAPATATG